MDIVEDVDDKSYNNNNGKPWGSSTILRVKPNFFIFSLFILFRHFSFSHFFQFFNFSIFIFSFVDFLFFFMFSFFHVSSFCHFFIFSVFFFFHFSSRFFTLHDPHFSSFTFIFFHFLSFSFIFCFFFFFFLLFFFLSEAQKYFFGPQFRCDISSPFQKKNFSAPLFLFFFPFFHPFSYFFFFFFFLFLVLFFHSFEKKLFFYLFFFSFCICRFLPSFNLEFNKRCFLRSRCSMDMWCPDDIGRYSWDWVGPPAWERACFNFPEWGGGSSLVKNNGASPDCIIVV